MKKVLTNYRRRLFYFKLAAATERTVLWLPSTCKISHADNATITGGNKPSKRSR